MISFKQFVNEAFDIDREAKVYGPKILKLIQDNPLGDARLDVYQKKDNPYLKDDEAKIRHILELIKFRDPTPYAQSTYTKWLLSLLLNGVNTLGGIDSDTTTTLLKLFEDLKKQKAIKGPETDIWKYKSIMELHRFIQDVYKDKTRFKTQDKLPKDKSQYVKILENDDVTIIYLKSHKAAASYNTTCKWCTSANNPNGEQMFTQYWPLFVIIPKVEEHPGELYQYGNLSYFDLRDEENKTVTLDEYSSEGFKYSNILKQATINFFKSEFGQNELIKRLKEHPAWTIELIRKNSDPASDQIGDPSRLIPLTPELLAKLKAATLNPMYGSRLKVMLDDLLQYGT